jgi:hypothetical protein
LTGKYTAPMIVHDAPGLLIIATSVADPSKTAEAVAFVYPEPTGVGVSPTTATVQINGVQQFTAFTDTGSPWGAIPAVNWGVSGTGCAGPSCGTIDATGKYTAPASAPSPPTVTVTATLVANSSKTGSATIMLGSNANNAKLNGQYAFLLSGFDGDGFMQVAGSFTADGNGNITAATEDVSRVLDVFAGLSFTGTYSVGADNRGSANLSTPLFTFPGAGFAVTSFSFALGDFAAGVAGRGDITHYYADEVSTGVLAKQDQTAFSPAAITGGYAFGFAGMGSTGNYLLAADGRFTAGGGSLSAGEMDVNDGGTTAPVAQFIGTYSTVDANGRATAALTVSGQSRLSNFVFYLVSGDELLWMQLDGRGNSSSPAIGGTALRQSGGPFSVRSLNGAGVLRLSAGCDTVVAEQSFDGSGKFNGILDEDSLGSDVCGDLAATSSGTLTSAAAFTGTYWVDNDGFGRGVIAVSGDQKSYPFYLVSPGKAFIIDSSARAGMFEPQTGGPFSNGSLSGNYFLGTLPLPMNWSAGPTSGTLTMDGSGSLNGITDGRASGLSFTGSYSVAPNGRATSAISSSAGSSTWIFYLISPSKAVGIQVDAGGANAGVRIVEK